MNRPIVSFEQDEVGDWTARLSCGHAQHTRHAPPMVERPWVLSEQGRDAKLGTVLDCARCDRFELPATHAPYKQTPHFTDATVPKALLNSHSTKPGVWGRIHVLEGRLAYVVEPPIDRRSVLTREAPGTVLPEVLHHVEPLGPVEFYVEFWKAL